MTDKIQPRATAHVEYVSPEPLERDVRITVIVTESQARNIAEYLGNNAYELWDTAQTGTYAQFGRQVFNALGDGIAEPEEVNL